MKAGLTQNTYDATRVSWWQVLTLAIPALGALLAEPLFSTCPLIGSMLAMSMPGGVEQGS